VPPTTRAASWARAPYHGAKFQLGAARVQRLTVHIGY